MRLRHLEVSGFRAFARKTEFDLRADTIILSGANGRGKTSFFDAVLWAITGKVPRIGDSKDLVSLYSPTGEARVQLSVGSTSRPGELAITRSCTVFGELRVKVTNEEGASLTGDEAELEIRRSLWPAAYSSDVGLDALTKAFTRSVYLEQDLLRQYLETDSDDERFAILSEIVGVGRITELQQEIARAKKAWTRGTTQIEDEAAGWNERVAELTSELERLGEVSAQSSDELEWDAWWNDVEPVVGASESPGQEDRKARLRLEGILEKLESLSEELLRKARRLRSVRKELDRLPEATKKPHTELHGRIERLQEELNRAEEALETAQEAASKHRAQLVSAKERADDLAALAEIALRHLGERCPVCTQSIDEDHTRAHLDQLLDSARGERHEQSQRLRREVEDASEEVQKLQERMGAALRETRELDQALSARRDAEEEIRSRLEELDIQIQKDHTWESVQERLDEEIDAIEERLEGYRDLIDRGETLALRLARLSEEFRRSAVEEQLEEAKSKAAEFSKRIERRERTGEMCEKVVSGLRDGEHEIVRREIRNLEPLLKQVYAKVDPHPTFRDVALAVTMYYGKGRLSTELRDPFLDEAVRDPGKYLSSSQLNALAMSIFLAFNCGTTDLPVEAVLMDDPIQSLDDINLLGVIDLLRRIRPRRQILISTHDRGYSRLLCRKLRPVDEGRKTFSFEFQDWSRKGPEILHQEIARQTGQLRVVA